MFSFLAFALLFQYSYCACPATYYAVNNDCVPIVNNLIVCDGNPMNIQCPEDRRIRILSTIYGRTSTTACPFDGHDTNVDCTDEKTVILQELCDGRQTCTGPPPIIFDWDPCYNTYKYLNITYVCEIDNPVIICQSQRQLLECCDNEVIHINSALWGRTDAKICPRANLGNKNNCTPADVTTAVVQSCEQRNECWIQATNGFLGGTDPCPGTSKYLEIDYDCVSRINEVYVCDGNDMAFSCPSGLVIRVLTATYGRQSHNICPMDGHDTYLACAVDKTAIIKQACDGLNSCNMPVPSSVFATDPCYNTYKYLDIDFICVNPADLGVVY